MDDHITARFHPMAPSGDAQAPRPLLACLGEGNTHPAAGQEPLPQGRPVRGRSRRPAPPPLPAGPRRQASQTNEVILMTATQSTQRHRATLWAGRLPRRGRPAGHPRRSGPDVGTCLAVQPGARGPGRAAGLAGQPRRAPADRQRPAHPQRRQLMQHAMTGTARPGLPADAEAMAPPSERWLELE